MSNSVEPAECPQRIILRGRTHGCGRGLDRRIPPRAVEEEDRNDGTRTRFGTSTDSGTGSRPRSAVSRSPPQRPHDMHETDASLISPSPIVSGWSTRPRRSTLAIRRYRSRSVVMSCIPLRPPSPNPRVSRLRIRVRRGCAVGSPGVAWVVAGTGRDMYRLAVSPCMAVRWTCVRPTMSSLETLSIPYGTEDPRSTARGHCVGEETLASMGPLRQCCGPAV